MTRTSTLVRLAVAGMTLLAVEAGAQIIHTPHDHVPNFAANPTIRSAANGAWSSPSTWIPARLPAPADIVSIAHTVTYDSTTGDADVIGIEAGGVLRFSISQTTRLRVGTLLVLPNGALEVGTASVPSRLRDRRNHHQGQRTEPVDRSGSIRHRTFVNRRHGDDPRGREDADVRSDRQ